MSIVYVDLSAKVEQWERDSAVAACNDITRILLIPGRVKQQVRQMLIRQHTRSSVHYRAFAVFIYLAIRDDLANIEQLVIDRDYSGANVEGVIKSLLLDLLHKDKPNLPNGFIRFENIAGQRADVFARECFQRKREADRMVRFEELEAILRK